MTVYVMATGDWDGVDNSHPADQNHDSQWNWGLVFQNHSQCFFCVQVTHDGNQRFLSFVLFPSAKKHLPKKTLQGRSNFSLQVWFLVRSPTFQTFQRIQVYLVL